MRVVCVSDLHIAGPGCPRQRAFLEFLAALECDQLCLCGDVFQHWWHWPDGRIFPEYQPVVDALARFPLVVLPGNHDFPAPDWFGPRGAAVPDASGVLQTRWDGVSVTLAHGDQADDSLGYRALSTLLRGRVFAAAISALSPQRAWSVLGRLVGHGEVRENPALLAKQAAWAGVQQGELVVYGHTHTPSLVVGAKTRVNIGDGVSHRTFVEVVGGLPSLREFAPPLHTAR